MYEFKILNNSYINQFRDYLMEAEKSQNTIDNYVRDMKQFLNWHKDDVNNITKETIKEYSEYLLELGLAVTSANRKLVSIHQYIIFLNDVFKMDIKASVRQFKVESQGFIDDTLENSDVRKLIKQAKKENDIRAITLIYTLFYTGARISEALLIKVSDIKEDAIMIKGKGSKYRQLLIPKKLKAQFKEYAKVRYDNSEYLFTGQRGPITRNTANTTLAEYAKRVRGLESEVVHPHAFRHLYAQNISELGVSPVIIKQLLGHSLTVTDRYMQVSKRKLLDTINKIDLNKV